MMRRAAFSCALLLLAAMPAGAERLITSLSSHQVLVTSSFTGIELVLFGSIERDAKTVSRKGEYDIIVTVAGPRETLVVRKKDHVLGIWTNAESRSFLKTPTYLGVLSNRPIGEIASAELLRRQEIGMYLVPRPALTSEIQSGEHDIFREALIRLRKQRKLYVEEPAGVTFLTPNLFRATIRLPAEAPVGNYDVDVRLFADGTELARAHSALEVVKVGIEQFIVNAAANHGILYGLFTTLMALATGWFASVIFRKD
ncbi:MAG: TIGR02186 family protein [Pseudorhodoplanes sp.]|uniref:TIGR02186 family protein n=1 Tax=Pseudorhodoplanes sp. TaxID=1934341 RepID=UPI003D0E085A